MSASSPSDAPVQLEIEGATATIWLNRPDRFNAIDMATAQHFARALARVERATTVEVLLLRARGNNFCAGGDVVDMAAAPNREVFIAELAECMHDALLGLANLSIPVVAVVQGAVAGAGLGLVLAADLTIATDSARFRTAYSGVGLSPDCGMSFWLPRFVGTGRALEMMLTDRVVDAPTASAWGLVTKVVPASDLDAEVRRLLDVLAMSSAPALGRSRTLARGGYDRTLPAHLDAEASTIADLAGGTEAGRRIASFVARR